MSKLKIILFNVIFCIQILLTFFLFAGDKIKLPVLLEVAGRLHPLILHLPIGLAISFFILILIPKRRNLDHKTLDVITFSVLLLTSFLASVTALFGFMLSLQDDYTTDSLATHKISGFVLSWLCYLILISYDRLKERKSIFYAVNSFALLILFLAGHTGATITHGENFVFKPLTKGEKQTLTEANSSVYQLSVEPILEKKCFSCHNELKRKGGLVMTSIASFKKGGKHGKEWVEGNPAASNLIKVIHLPLTHDQHMPPDGKAQLTAKETDLLRLWIQSGADFEMKMTDLGQGDSLKLLASSMTVGKQIVEEKAYSFKPASESVIEKLNSPFCSLFPLFQNSPALRADFFVKGAFQIKALENLSEVQNQLVELNLSHMPITDKELSLVARFKNLEKLNLNFTNVASDLSSLQTLAHLKSLSLSGTKVDATAVSKILSLPELNELFIWNTSISNEDQAKLTSQHKKLSIIWNIFRDTRATKLSPPAIVNDGVLKRNEALVLKHVMPGASIRYTLDGSEPDSIKSEMYKTPIQLEGVIKLKARAYKDGWLGSDVYEAMCFTEGNKAEEIGLLTKPDPQYPGEGAKSLMDGRKGVADLFKEPSWLGFKENSFVAEFGFGKESPPVKNIVISYGRNTGSYIFPPKEVEVWAGDSKESMALIKTIKPLQPTTNEPAKVEALIIPLAYGKKNYYKLIAKPVSKLPAWHSGKGEKGWFFLDEVFFN